MYCLFCDYSVLFVCICVLNYCHRVATQLQLNTSYHISFHITSYHNISHHISHCIISCHITSYISHHITSHYIIYHIISMVARKRLSVTLYEHCLSFLFPSYLNLLQPRPSILYMVFLFSFFFHCSCCNLFRHLFHNRYYLREMIYEEGKAARRIPGKVQV
jgi:hypothetical protein